MYSAENLSMISGEIAGKITLKHVYEIALIKQQDPPLRVLTLEHICRQIIGAARSVGVEV